ncbi:TPA: XRE family transcriptional regulator, partial [Enterococcus faecalis]
EYFNVSVDYLLGRTDNTKATDEKNSDDLDDVLDNVMSFDGEPLDDHDREVIRAYLKGRFGK